MYSVPRTLSVIFFLCLREDSRNNNIASEYLLGNKNSSPGSRARTNENDADAILDFLVTSVFCMVRDLIYFL